MHLFLSWGKNKTQLISLVPFQQRIKESLPSCSGGVRFPNTINTLFMRASVCKLVRYDLETPPSSYKTLHFLFPTAPCLHPCKILTGYYVPARLCEDAGRRRINKRLPAEH